MKSIMILSVLISISAITGMLQLYFVFYLNIDSERLILSLYANALVFLVFNLLINNRLNAIINKELSNHVYQYQDSHHSLNKPSSDSL